MNANNTENQEKPSVNIQCQFLSQWIVSLAISVVCCAVLFVLFASYMVGMHDRDNMMEIRIELLQDKYKRLNSDFHELKKKKSALLLRGDPLVHPVQAYKLVPIAPSAKKEKINQNDNGREGLPKDEQ